MIEPFPAVCGSSEPASRTVAYQRAVARRYVDWENGALVGEVLAIEASPDRGTSAIEGDVARAGRLCREGRASLLFVNFVKKAAGVRIRS